MILMWMLSILHALLAFWNIQNGHIGHNNSISEEKISKFELFSHSLLRYVPHDFHGQTQKILKEQVFFVLSNYKVLEFDP